MRAILQFLNDERGATAVEYAVMLALIVVSCLATIQLFGANTAAAFGDIRDQISVFMGS